MTYVSPYSSYEKSSVIAGYDIVAIHDNRRHGEDSFAINAPFSSSVKINAVLSDSSLYSTPKAEFQGVMQGKVNDENITSSFFVSRDNAPLTIAVVDGATSALIDGKDPSNLDKDGNPSLIDESLLDATNVALFSQALSKSIVQNSSENIGTDSLEVYKMTIKGITAGEPYASKNVPHDITPSATLSILKESKDGETLEATVMGDQTVIIAYDDGSYDLVTADKGIKALESERKKVIKEQYPEYGELASSEQKKIRMKVMKEVMRPLNGDKYYVPFPDKNDTLNKFLEIEQKFERDNRRTLTRYGENSDVVRIKAKAKQVSSVIMSTDGFVERGIKYGIASPEDFISADERKLKEIKNDIRLHEDDNRISHDDMTLVKIDVKLHYQEKMKEQKRIPEKFKQATNYACGTTHTKDKKKENIVSVPTPAPQRRPSRSR